MEKPEVFGKCGIDSDIIAYSTAFATQDKSLEELHDAIDGLVNYIVDSTVVFNTEDTVSGYLTGKDNFRYDIAKTYIYKGNRKDAEKPKWLSEARDYMVDRYGFVVVNGIEADDALAMEATSYHDPDAYVICSLDKDYHTVPGWKFDFRKGVFSYDTPHDANKFFYTQLLTGDSADNIKGLHRIGPKKAEKILEGALTTYEMYARVLKAYEEKCTDGNPKERVLENGRLLHLQRFVGEEWTPPH